MDLGHGFWNKFGLYCCVIVPCQVAQPLILVVVLVAKQLLPPICLGISKFNGKGNKETVVIGKGGKGGWGW